MNSYKKQSEVFNKKGEVSMREKTKGRVTIPTDMDVVAETLEIGRASWRERVWSRV